MPHPGLLHSEPQPLQQATADLYLHRRHSNTQRQVCLSLCGVYWCTQVLFEPFKNLWWVWGLILNVILPLLLSCWGFSFALGHGYLLKATPALHSPHSSAYCLAGVSLTLDVGYLLMAAPVPCSWNSYRLI